MKNLAALFRYLAKPRADYPDFMDTHGIDYADELVRTLPFTKKQLAFFDAYQVDATTLAANFDLAICESRLLRQELIFTGAPVLSFGLSGIAGWRGELHLAVLMGLATIGGAIGVASRLSHRFGALNQAVEAGMHELQDLARTDNPFVRPRVYRDVTPRPGNALAIGRMRLLNRP